MTKVNSNLSNLETIHFSATENQRMVYLGLNYPQKQIGHQGQKKRWKRKTKSELRFKFDNY